MKKILSLLLTLCLLCACCAAGAETAETCRYDRNGFSVDLPVGWDNEYVDGDATFYYAKIDGSANLATLMFLANRNEAYAGNLTDDELKEAYNQVLQDAVASATDGNLNYCYSEIAGKLSVLYCLTQDIDGVPSAVAYDMAIIDGWLFGLVILHADSDASMLADYLDTIGMAVQYSPAQPLTAADLPTEDDPFRFEAAITARQNMLLPQWMVDESTRALFTMTMMLDMDNSYGDFSGDIPLNIMNSMVGSGEDTLRTIFPSQDESVAIILEYNADDGTGLFYAKPWNEETRGAFETSCDECYANTEDALNYIVGLLMEALQNPAE